MPIRSSALCRTVPQRAPGTPVDRSREAPAVAALRRRGFTSDFLVQGDTLRVAGTDRHLRPDPASGAVLDRMAIARRQGRLRWHRVMIPMALGGAAAYGLMVLARRLRAA